MTLPKKFKNVEDEGDGDTNYNWVHGTVTVNKWLLKGLEDLEVGSWVETIQRTALLKTARILRRVLETFGELLSLNLMWKTISLRWCEKL